MARENKQRKLVEERVLEMMETTRSLPPPASPATSQKENSSWWSAAKNKLTPTKDKDKEKDKDRDPLTPAQQIIHDSKTRGDKDKRSLKGKERSVDWQDSPQTTPSKQPTNNLSIPRKPVPGASSPTSPGPSTPTRPSLSNLPPNLTPSPMRSNVSLASSPSRDAPPMYAQFNPQGTLDVPGTVLAIAKRFEKLEKWTVGHVRALEERMNDVERWLVEKEKEKENADSASVRPPGNTAGVSPEEVGALREELTELQSRMGEMGRQMARLASSSSGGRPTPRQREPSTPSPPNDVETNHTGSSTNAHQRFSSTALETTTPPLASRKPPAGTRLPYPQGDYNAPPDAFSPPNSPPGSLTKASRPRTISGLPNASAAAAFYGTGSLGSSSSLSLSAALGSPTPGQQHPKSSSASAAQGRVSSPSPLSSTGLPPPKTSQPRQSSVSPTPRKRYTVALGGPLVDPEEEPVEPPRRTGTPKSFSSQGSLVDEDDESDGMNEETIGKSAASKLTGSSSISSKSRVTDVFTTPSKAKPTTKQAEPQNGSLTRRQKAQSVYSMSSMMGSSTFEGTNGKGKGSTAPSVAPLRVRSKSSERPSGGLGSPLLSSSSSGSGTGRWVDPLVLRKQSRENLKQPLAMPRPMGGKASITQLVAFFDKDKAGKA